MQTIDGLPAWMFKMLRVHGNTIVTKKRLKRMGKDHILEILKKHGLDCVIVESRVNDFESDSYYGKKHRKSTNNHMLVILKEKYEYES